MRVGPAGIAWEEEDAAGWSAGELATRLEALARRPFDLARGPLWRIHLFALPGGEWRLLFAIHHIVADFWSLAILVDELGFLYEAELGGAPLLRPSGGSAGGRDEPLEGPAEERLAAFWGRQLAGPPPVLELPLDRPRPAVRSGWGAAHPLALDMRAAEGARALSSRSGATLFMTLLAAYQALLGRYTGQEDLVVGSPSAGRDRADRAREIGYFVNPLALRADLSGLPSFADLLARVRGTVLAAFKHQEDPFVRLVERISPHREPGRPPLVETMFSLQKAPSLVEESLAAFALSRPGFAWRAGGLVLEPVALPRLPVQFDLTLLTAEVEGSVFGSLLYDSDLFEASTICRFGLHFVALVVGLTADPSRGVWDVGLMSEGERQQVLVEWNGAEPELSGETVVELFGGQARRCPEAVALVAGEERLTYGELWRRSSSLSLRLRGLGVGPEVLVGLYAERSAALVVGALGVLLSGGAYVPLDPAYPAARVSWMLSDCAAPVVLTQRSLAGALPAGGARTVLLDEVTAEEVELEGGGEAVTVLPGSLAYVIYTSGSTGRPKGVGVSHGSLASLVRWHLEAFAVTSVDCGSVVAGPGFDASVWEIWPYLCAGASLALVPEELRSWPERLWSWLSAAGVTVAFLPTPLAEGVLALASREESGVRCLLTGGDRLRLPRRLGSSPRLVNNYGPTEATVVTTSGTVSPGSSPGSLPPIGRLIAGVRGYLAKDLELVPLGASGELLVGGPGLARGYRGLAGLTAERFVPDPFSGEPGERLYRTGDLCRYRSSGELEFLGRLDQQIKVRGFRIEPGEIESALLRCPGVESAVVVLRESVLVAYVVGRDDAEGLRSWLRGELPSSMVPSAIVTLPGLPLTANGKIDRQALPAPAPAGEERVAPRTPVEELLAGFWSELLRVSEVGVHDHFFALGGHSLLVTRLVSQVRRTLGVELAVRRVFESPTVAALAQEVEGALAAESPALGGALVAVARGVDLPLSFAQQRLWFLDRLEPGSPFYNLPLALRLRGRLERGALAGALSAVVGRHEVLRTVFGAREGVPVQRPLAAQGLPLPEVDLSGLPDRPLEAELLRLVREESRRPFDLESGPVLRALLTRQGEADHGLLLTLHHIAGDGGSLGIFLRELEALYAALAAGRRPALAPLPVQYADFAAWQREELSGAVLERELGYWRERLAGLPVLELPADRPRAAVQRFRGAARRLRLPGAGLRELGRREGATLFMTLLAAFAALLGRYGRQEDLAVGSPVAGRTRPETEGLIGFFVNTLVLRIDLSGGPSFSRLLARAREAGLGAYTHQQVPFERLVEELRPERDLSRSALFQVMLALDPETPPPALPGLQVERLAVAGETSRFDLSLALSPGEELSGFLEYDSDLFEASTICRFGLHFVALVVGLTADPSRGVWDVGLMSEGERQQVLVEWNGSGARALGRDGGGAFRGAGTAGP